MPTVTIQIDTNSLEGYRKFIKCKALPIYKVSGTSIITDEVSYNRLFGNKDIAQISYEKDGLLFDYQLFILNTALRLERYAVFADCGLGKTRIELTWAKSIAKSTGKRVLVLCPLAVMDDQQREAEIVLGYRMSNLRKEKWNTPIGIINYESMRDIDMRTVSGIVLDESSILKNGDGKIRQYLTELAQSVRYRLACSATPSPNDQSEYATHAVWLGYASTIKEYYSRYFRKDGTDWALKHHATNAFYRNLSSWACYIKSPSSLGFQQGAEMLEEPNYIVQDSETDIKYMKRGKLFADTFELCDASLVFTELRSDPTQSRFKNAISAITKKRTIIWCNRNQEELAFHHELNDAIIVNGSTPIEQRVEIINAFRSGEIRYLISKPKVLGFGVNLPQAEVHLYSGYTFSFEEFYQAVRRSHRFGRIGRLNVIVPVSMPEIPVWSKLQQKLYTFDSDVKNLQALFFRKESGVDF